jgi:hypothetical protein
MAISMTQLSAPSREDLRDRAICLARFSFLLRCRGENIPKDRPEDGNK